MNAKDVPTRDRIVAATAELFRRQGYNGTGLKQVVAEARAPFGSLYHHFPGGKDQLAEEVVRTDGTFFQAHVTGVYDAEPTPEEAVRAVFAGAAETLAATDYEDACPIATVALEVASTNDALRRATADVFEQWTAALTERLGDRDLALGVLAALEGAFVLSRAQRSTEPLLAAGRMAAERVAWVRANEREGRSSATGSRAGRRPREGGDVAAPAPAPILSARAVRDRPGGGSRS